MRRAMWSIVVTLALVTAALGVTEQELAEQAAVVVAEQARLDSLSSLAHAETWQTVIDSTEATLSAAAVTVHVHTAATETGLRDPDYVDVDLSTAYAGWDSLTQRQWAADLRDSGIDATARSAGRYSMHGADVGQFLAFIGAFITPQEE